MAGILIPIFGIFVGIALPIVCFIAEEKKLTAEDQRRKTCHEPGAEKQPIGGIRRYLS
jgi:hypothetical protein